MIGERNVEYTNVGESWSSQADRDCTNN